MRYMGVGILLLCLAAGACELLISLRIRSAPTEELWCGEADGPRCPRLKAELGERPWSRERVVRLCATLNTSRSACEVTWTMHHDRIDRQFDDIYVVLSVLVIAMSCALLVALMNGTKASPSDQRVSAEASPCECV